MTVQGIIQQEQSSPHQQGILTPGVTRLMAWFEEEEEEVAEEEEEVEGVERAVVVGVVMTFLGIVAVLWLEVLWLEIFGWLGGKC